MIRIFVLITLLCSCTHKQTPAEMIAAEDFKRYSAEPEDVVDIQIKLSKMAYYLSMDEEAVATRLVEYRRKMAKTDCPQWSIEDLMFEYLSPGEGERSVDLAKIVREDYSKLGSDLTVSLNDQCPRIIRN